MKFGEMETAIVLMDLSDIMEFAELAPLTQLIEMEHVPVFQIGNGTQINSSVNTGILPAHQELNGIKALFHVFVPLLENT